MQNPDSLVPRAKYFPRDSFLSSVVGTRPSLYGEVCCLQ
jgi:hypothetical protein